MKKIIMALGLFLSLGSQAQMFSPYGFTNNGFGNGFGMGQGISMQEYSMIHQMLEGILGKLDIDFNPYPGEILWYNPIEGVNRMSQIDSAMDGFGGGVFDGGRMGMRGVSDYWGQPANAIIYQNPVRTNQT
jgi:hypothetical protein